LTKTGYGFLATGVIIYLVASQTQVGWLYLIDAIIWSLFILSAIIPRYSLKPLQVEHQIILSAISDRQFTLTGPIEDETVEIIIKVSNNSRLARHFIRIQVDCPFERPEQRITHFLLTAVKSSGITMFSYLGTCYQRGYYPFLSVTLKSGGPLGLVESNRTFQLPLNLTVYPFYYQMEKLQTTGEEEFDWNQGIKSSASNEFYGSREYQYGDALKHIHWRNTAKTRQIMLKEFEQSKQGLMSVIFPTVPDYGTDKETTLEYSIKIAASLVKLCADSGKSIDIITDKEYLHNGNWEQEMNFLAKLETNNYSTRNELPASIDQNTTIIVIVPDTRTTIDLELKKIIDQGKKLVVVLLEDFDSRAEYQKITNEWEKNNTSVIHCTPGNLEAVIKGLSRLNPISDYP